MIGWKWIWTKKGKRFERVGKFLYLVIEEQSHEEQKIRARIAIIILITNSKVRMRDMGGKEDRRQYVKRIKKKNTRSHF